MLTPGEREVLAAAMDRILPAGECPGATRANAIAYADWVLARDSAGGAAAAVASGVALLDSLAQGMWGCGFAACPPDQRDAVISRLEGVPHRGAQRFFSTLVMLTLTGFLSPPRYGGNRDRVGWDFIGYTPHPHSEGAQP